MTLMSRQKLHEVKRTAKKLDFYPTTQLVHSLVDHGISALDELEGGKSTQELRAELVERERQIKLALRDLWAALEVAEQNVLRHDDYPDGPLALRKAQLITELIDEMLKAKGPQWKRQWDWYSPRIAEEFGE